MADSYTTHSKLTQMEVGSHETSWGAVWNGNLDLIEEMAWGYTTKSISGNTTLSAISNGATSETRHACINFTGTLSVTTTVTLPSGLARILAVVNSTNQTLTFKYASGSTVDVAAGNSALLLCTGSNVIALVGTATNATTLNSVAASSYALLSEFVNFSLGFSYKYNDLGSAASFTPDAATGNVFKMTASGASLTINNPSNLTNGQELQFLITGASLTSLTFGAKFLFPGGTAPTFSGVGNTDMLVGVYDSGDDVIYARYYSDFS